MVYIYWINIDYYFWSQLVPWFSTNHSSHGNCCVETQIGPSRMSRASKTKRSEPGAVPGRPGPSLNGKLPVTGMIFQTKAADIKTIGYCY